MKDATSTTPPANSHGGTDRQVGQDPGAYIEVQQSDEENGNEPGTAAAGH